ncbi:MAG: hypothetical protein LBK50_03575 [Candidatus Nomurabacteria bacterium]|jgi:hypothetical protein|nr:hypothetical protein [Candidatus Nomurabacteria bacterium]
MSELENTHDQRNIINPAIMQTAGTSAVEQKLKVANKRQQDKLIAAIVTGDITCLSNPEVRINDDVKNYFLDQLARGGISEDQTKQIFARIGSTDPAKHQEKRRQYEEQYNILVDEAMKRRKSELTPRPVPLDRMAPSDSREWLNNTRIDGDTYESGGQEYKLNIAHLEQFGLGPKYKADFGGKEIGLSDVYMVGRHPAIVGYVKDGKQVSARSFYQSKSQGMWRLLPDYTVNRKPADGKKWYGKGYDEQSTNLPFQLQKACEQIIKTGIKNITDQTDPNFVFLGTAKRYANKDEYNEKLHHTHEMRGDYYREVNPNGQKIISQRSNSGKIPPEAVDVANNLQPDFSQKFAEYTVNTDLYGSVTTEVFPSQDLSLNYIFCRDKNQRAWVSGIESVSNLTDTGVYRKWVDGGDLITPPMEYGSSAGGYGNDKIKDGKYVDMFTNYLSKVPIIQKYLRLNRAGKNQI